jgi:hypothetical protein
MSELIECRLVALTDESVQLVEQFVLTDVAMRTARNPRNVVAHRLARQMIGREDVSAEMNNAKTRSGEQAREQESVKPLQWGRHSLQSVGVRARELN